MNRDILFRGQDANCNWHEGFVFKGNQGTYILKNKIENDKIGLNYFKPIEVKPETVGQFTGLTDKNGVRIFEGDIVKTTKRIGVCVFYLGCFVIDDLKETTDHDSSSPLLWEVIGNIHDTPNLLTK